MKKIRIIILILLILLILILAYFTVFSNKDKGQNSDVGSNNNVQSQEIKQYEVTNSNKFFTIQTCIEKYINYVYLKDAKSLFILLDDEYKTKLNVTEANVLEKVENIENYSNFKAEKMLYSVINNQEVYYVKGYIEEESMEEYGKREDFIITIKLNESNMTFSVIPFGYGGAFYEKN